MEQHCCHNCQKYETKGHPFNVCSNCQNIKYCSKSCQINDWHIHKKTCKLPELICSLHSKYQCRDEKCQQEMLNLAIPHIQSTFRELNPCMLTDEVRLRAISYKSKK